MSYTRAVFDRLQAMALVALAVGLIAISYGASDAYAFSDAPAAVTIGSSDNPQGQDAAGREPEANLPFLFAVFFITWAAFFGYVFVMSRRQRQMRSEIDALKETLATREQRSAQAEADTESQGP